ncbi:MAG: hypothetical protein OXQ29_09555 [Rhodospirillaceae bacterium]|nr:hypothetical protein [Rhodospirillaceae bacterium]
MTNSNSGTCFVIAPIGDPESDIRKRSDQVLRHIIGPAAEECGYSTVRADTISSAGIITNQILQHIVDDPLVIADLTGRNPNVFYELAVRHATRKPLVQLIQEGETIPFDVSTVRTISVDHRDLDAAATAKARITDQIRSFQDGRADLESPLSVSLDLQRLRQSDNPEQRSLAELLSEMSNLSNKIDNVLSSERSSWRSKLTPHRLQQLNALLRAVPPRISFLISLSFFRESIPWVFEIGAEGYRSLEAGDLQRAQETARLLSFIADFAGDIFYMSPELYDLFSDLRTTFDRALEALQA